MQSHIGCICLTFLHCPLCIECENDDNVRVSKLCKVDLMRKEKCVSSRQNECGKWQQFERVCQHKSGISEKLKKMNIYLSNLSGSANTSQESETKIGKNLYLEYQEISLCQHKSGISEKLKINFLADLSSSSWFNQPG